jgi:hypothetical protein
MSREEIVSDFNKKIISLIGILKQKNPSDSSIDLLKNRIITAKNINSECIISLSGPVLFKYREIIDNLKVDIVEQLGGISEVHMADGTTEEQFVKEIIGKACETYSKFKPVEKQSINGSIRFLLDRYLEYLAFSL